MSGRTRVAHERILVVEDEKITGMDICQTVHDLGYEPMGPIASGEDAYEVALSTRPDLILMDITLKGSIDGIAAAVAIRYEYRCPVIFVTAHSDQITFDRARIAEPAGWVLKPVNEEELHTAIEKALRLATVGEETANAVRLTLLPFGHFEGRSLEQT